MVCRGICDRYKAKKDRYMSRYALGQKRCQACSTWMWWEGGNCPCCSMKLRCRPRSKYSKRVLSNHMILLEESK